MKQYKFTLSVPDDFDPANFGVDFSYPDGEIGISGEGYVSIEDIAKDLKLEKLDLTSTSVVIFRMPQEVFDTDLGSMQLLVKSIENKFGATCICLSNDEEVMVKNAAEATTMLKGMIDKINAKSIIKLV